MREWLSGGAPPCQGGGRGFDPRLALSYIKEDISMRYPLFIYSSTAVLEGSIFSSADSVRAKRLPPATSAVSRSHKVFHSKLRKKNFISWHEYHVMILFYSLLIQHTREWLSGGAPPCQGGGRGFDPRLALFFILWEALILLASHICCLEISCRHL